MILILGDINEAFTASLKGAGDSKQGWLRFGKDGSGNGTKIGSDSNGNFIIQNTGNVGIGTSKPTAKFAVNGVVKAHEVSVTILQSDWPDYVFRKDYVLPSLDSVSHTIMRLGHLPGMPSAEEVKKNGISLGEMDRKLLEKIEELTLLLIEQAKKADKQEKRISELEKLFL